MRHFQTSAGSREQRKKGESVLATRRTKVRRLGCSLRRPAEIPFHNNCRESAKPSTSPGSVVFSGGSFTRILQQPRHFLSDPSCAVLVLCAVWNMPTFKLTTVDVPVSRFESALLPHRTPHACSCENTSTAGGSGGSLEQLHSTKVL